MERQEAMQQGLTRYFTGRACSKGHLAERYTKSGNCAACIMENLQSVAAESAVAKNKFMENTERIFLYVYDVDFETVKIFVSAACTANMDIGLEAFKETFAKIKEVGDGVHQCRVRVPKAIKTDIYKLAEAFLAQHRVLKTS